MDTLPDWSLSSGGIHTTQTHGLTCLQWSHTAPCACNLSSSEPRHTDINECFCVLDQDIPELHPLLVAQMRDKRTTIPVLDASLLPDGPNGFDGFLGGNRALEMRGELGKLANEAHQALQLFLTDCMQALANILDIFTPRIDGDTYHPHNARPPQHLD
jgi:hypothetical protein